MADFCWQCTEALGVPGEQNDFAHSESWNVLCEGCGPTLVDGEGRCAWAHCPKHGRGDEATGRGDEAT